MSPPRLSRTATPGITSRDSPLGTRRRRALLALVVSLSTPALAAPRKQATTATASDAVGTRPDDVGLAVGAPAPTGLRAQNMGGETVVLDDLFAMGPTLVAFYRGGWCPYCSHQLWSLSQAAPEFASRGVSLVALSVDKPDQAKVTAASWEIPFPVLSDSALAVHEAFGVVFRVDEATQETYRGWGIDLEAASGRTDGAIAVPSLFRVQDGAIAWAHADPSYKVRSDPEQVLAALPTAAE